MFMPTFLDSVSIHFKSNGTMDPVSIIGLVGTAASFTDLIAKTISKLFSLKSTYDNAPLQISSLISQLSIIKTATEQLASRKLRRYGNDRRYRQLDLQLQQSLASFYPLMASLEECLGRMELATCYHSNMRSRQRKLLYLWNEPHIATCLALLDRHTNALNLLLQTIQQYRPNSLNNSLLHNNTL
jgi:hypothetical protein